MSPAVLGQALASLPPQHDPRVLVGTSTADDAGVYRLSDELALVQTVDFFTPIVDDPYTYGRIAAANALSDVYAMGAKPLTALNIVCYPEKLDPEGLALILQGGQERATAAGVAVIGGHTVTDKELKYGMAVTGIVHPERVVTNAGARPGDWLVLTKPLGTGILTTAFKAGKGTPELVARVAESMWTLNDVAAEAMLAHGVHAATDITGNGLLGHAWEMARASGVRLRLRATAIPVFEEALYFARRGYLTRGDVSNREYTQGHVQLDPRLSPEQVRVLFDPQTSGGLLIALPPAQAEALVATLQARGVSAAAVVGEVEAGPAELVVLP
ncbi:MAG: selenide, water dikinase [Candidatus Tectimicrobiota bacterium]|nr:MAG: selenide, water dikinase [Candidatus Tectomicrobia bacterium]